MVNSLSLASFISASEGAREGDVLHVSPAGIQAGPRPSWFARLFKAKQIREENSAAWRVFHRAVEETYGKKRMQRMCERYYIDLIQNQDPNQKRRRK